MSHVHRFVFLVVNPGGLATPRMQSGDTLEILQEHVGGNIETATRFELPRSDDPEVATCIDAYCNEDGIALELAPNRVIYGGEPPILGPIVVCASNCNGDTISLDVRTMSIALNWVRSWLVGGAR